MLLSQATLAIDRALGDEAIPLILETTVESGRTVLSTIASGLIASITLLLSLMLVAVQLASSQFSPRSLRGWIGDDVQKRTIGVVLGTTVYCLLILRETRTIADGEALIPNVSVLLALAGGVVSLIAVVRSVDHLTNSLRIGQVAATLADATVAIIEKRNQAVPSDQATPERPHHSAPDDTESPPPDATPVTAATSGWIQQIDEDAVLAALNDDATAYVTASLGHFTLPHAPLAWIHPPPDDERCLDGVGAAFAVGDTRTMQQDMAFGIVQLVDIALRALSPGVNDPSTAVDVIDHLGVIILALWERPALDAIRVENRRRLIARQETHREHLRTAFGQLRRYGCDDVVVAAAMVRTLATLHGETIRRELPGPLQPIEELIGEILQAVDASDLAASDRAAVTEEVPEVLRAGPTRADQRR